MKLTLIGYLAAGAALVIVLLLAGLSYERHMVKVAKSENVACQADRQNFAATQTANLATVDDLTHRLAVLAEARKVEQGAAAKAIASADQQATQADQKAQTLTDQLAALYAKDGHARAWGSAGVDAGVAARLPGSGR